MTDNTYYKQDEPLPEWESLVNAITKTERFLEFAKSYIHNGHLKGATDALKAIKREVSKGLKVKRGTK